MLENCGRDCKLSVEEAHVSIAITLPVVAQSSYFSGTGEGSFEGTLVRYCRRISSLS